MSFYNCRTTVQVYIGRLSPSGPNRSLLCGILYFGRGCATQGRFQIPRISQCSFQVYLAKMVWVDILFNHVIVGPNLQKENRSIKPFSKGLHELCHLFQLTFDLSLEHYTVSCFSLLVLSDPVHGLPRSRSHYDWSLSSQCVFLIFQNLFNRNRWKFSTKIIRKTRMSTSFSTNITYQNNF